MYVHNILKRITTKAFITHFFMLRLTINFKTTAQHISIFHEIPNQTLFLYFSFFLLDYCEHLFDNIQTFMTHYNANLKPKIEFLIELKFMNIIV